MVHGMPTERNEEVTDVEFVCSQNRSSQQTVHFNSGSVLTIPFKLSIATGLYRGIAGNILGFLDRCTDRGIGWATSSYESLFINNKTSTRCFFRSICSCISHRTGSLSFT